MRDFQQFLIENFNQVEVGMVAKTKDKKGPLVGREFEIIDIDDDEVEIKFLDNGETALTKIDHLNIDAKSVK